MIKRFEVKTTAATQFIDITTQIKSLVRAEKMSSGMIMIYVPHTTCGITINENVDPDVKEDIINTLERLVPRSMQYKHGEGNAHAHVKASLLGVSVNVYVESSTMVLGTWQGIYLAEFDGPRQRSVLVKLIPD
jgi:secondary thiamine-phosphate synthase enzyme